MRWWTGGGGSGGAVCGWCRVKGPRLGWRRTTGLLTTSSHECVNCELTSESHLFKHRFISFTESWKSSQVYT